MRRSTTVNVIIHCPKSDAGRRELERRVATVHADAAKEYIEALPCPAAQKMALTGNIANAAK